MSHFFFSFFTFFLPHVTACGILVYQPGIEPTTPALEAQSLNHWTNRDVPSPGHSEGGKICDMVVNQYLCLCAKLRE